MSLLCLKSYKPTLKAFLMWISSPILWASAHWNVIGCSADGILATRVTFTRVSTVVLYAGLVTGTLVIMLTFPSFDFGKKGKRSVSIKCQPTIYAADLLCTQRLKGSPVKPGGHLHWAL